MSCRWKGIFQRLEHNVKENSSMSKNAILKKRIKHQNVTKIVCSLQIKMGIRQLENFDGDSWLWRSILIGSFKSGRIYRIAGLSGSYIWMYWMLVQFEGVGAGTEIKKLKESWTVIQLLIHRRSQGFSQNSQNSKWSWKRLARCFPPNDIKIAFSQKKPEESD